MDSMDLVDKMDKMDKMDKVDKVDKVDKMGKMDKKRSPASGGAHSGEPPAHRGPAIFAAPAARRTIS